MFFTSRKTLVFIHMNSLPLIWSLHIAFFSLTILDISDTWFDNFPQTRLSNPCLRNIVHCNKPHSLPSLNSLSEKLIQIGRDACSRKTVYFRLIFGFILQLPSSSWVHVHRHRDYWNISASNYPCIPWFFPLCSQESSVTVDCCVRVGR